MSLRPHDPKGYCLVMDERFLEICLWGSSPHCKAFILTHLARLDVSREPGPISLREWHEALLGLYSRRTISKCLHDLLDERLISRVPFFDRKTRTLLLVYRVDQTRIAMHPNDGEVVPA